jgi:hypothetical protein
MYMDDAGMPQETGGDSTDGFMGQGDADRMFAECVMGEFDEITEDVNMLLVYGKDAALKKLATSLQTAVNNAKSQITDWLIKNPPGESPEKTAKQNQALNNAPAQGTVQNPPTQT